MVASGIHIYWPKPAERERYCVKWGKAHHRIARHQGQRRPTASAKLECFQRPVFRINEPHVAHSKIGVDFALPVFVDVACGWRKHLAHPIRNCSELTLRPMRHRLESPSGEIRYQNIFFGEMDFRFICDPPSSGISLVMTERMLYDLKKRCVSHDMRGERPRQGIQSAVDDLCHMACGCLQYVLIRRLLARLRWRCQFSLKFHHLLQFVHCEGYYTLASSLRIARIALASNFNQLRELHLAGLAPRQSAASICHGVSARLAAGRPVALRRCRAWAQHGLCPAPWGGLGFVLAPFQTATS